jgi:hypothetical protein
VDRRTSGTRSAHDDAGVELLKAVARQRLAGMVSETNQKQTEAVGLSSILRIYVRA